MPARLSKRRKRNISGLRNQPKTIHEPSPSKHSVVEPTSESDTQRFDPKDATETNEDEDLGLRCVDSLKPLWREDDDDDDDDMEEELLVTSETDDLESEEKLYSNLMSFSIDNGDDPTKDGDWGLRRKEQGYFH